MRTAIRVLDWGAYRILKHVVTEKSAAEVQQAYGYGPGESWERFAEALYTAASIVVEEFCNENL